MDDRDTPPRVFVAHQQVHDLFLLALLSRHPDPQAVMRQFRKLVDDLTTDDTSLDHDQSFLAIVRRSAAGFERLVSSVLPATSTIVAPNAAASEAAARPE